MRLKKLIVAAGGILYRCEGEEMLCAIVKTAKHNAWCLPKGKVDADDTTLLATAVREVQEETGCQVESLGYAGSFRYRIASGLKMVAMWHMKVVQENCQPLFDDILEIQWVPLSEAVVLLHRVEERRFLRQAFQLNETRSPLSNQLDRMLSAPDDIYSAFSELRLADSL